MTAFGCNPRALHAGRSATDNDHMAGRTCRYRIRFVVMAKSCVDGTHRLATPEVLRDTDETVNAGTNQIGAAGIQASHQVGICQELPAHRHEVGVAATKDAFSVRRTDSPNRENGYIDRFFHTSGQALILIELPRNWCIGEPNPGPC